ncbi:hypothetical protein SEMRO_336_G120330.1 [Seminavis robusta]|uniref:Uncharacterized protein n=1 Tax=Seminavis robusta TaxID=568900 RepID=A0A9N8DSD7_9STRA|nr:hypothetical protein SEMRO_336_G120330.1 [Seminavis robusta]|eukprot:Sro336_g120330.1 n/a (311) ;mRNA; f:32108-33040
MENPSSKTISPVASANDGSVEILVDVPYSPPNKIRHRDVIHYNAEKTFVKHTIRDLIAAGFDLVGHANNQVKIVNMQRKWNKYPPLKLLTLEDIEGLWWIKYGKDGYRICLNPDINAHPDLEDLNHFTLMKLVLPHPKNHHALTRILCDAFDWNIDVYREVYDRHLACLNLTVDDDGSIAESDDDDESAPSVKVHIEGLSCLKNDSDFDTDEDEAATKKEDEEKEDEIVELDDKDDSELIKSPTPAGKRRYTDCLSQVACQFDYSVCSKDAVKDILLETPLRKKKSKADPSARLDTSEVYGLSSGQSPSY